ncbi:hypothetical protein Tco_0756354 [Tanacetum coccineum]
MSSATSDVTYTSVYSDSEPGRAFWGTDYEEPVAPPSPDYILGPENLQILPVPQDEDEREPIHYHPIVSPTIGHRICYEWIPRRIRREYEDDETEDVGLTIRWTGEMMEHDDDGRYNLGKTLERRMRTVDVPESEQRLPAEVCICSTICSPPPKYETERFPARPVISRGQGIRLGLSAQVDAEERRQED